MKIPRYCINCKRILKHNNKSGFCNKCYLERWRKINKSYRKEYNEAIKKLKENHIVEFRILLSKIKTKKLKSKNIIVKGG